MRKIFIILHHRILTESKEPLIQTPYMGLISTGQALRGTHSSVFSFLIPSHSLSFFCLTPFWVSHLENRQEAWESRVALLKYSRERSIHCASDIHQILVSGLAQLNEVRLDAVHPLVDLSVVCCLLLKILLQPSLTVYYFTYPGLQLLVVPHDPKKTQTN